MPLHCPPQPAKGVAGCGVWKTVSVEPVGNEPQLQLVPPLAFPQSISAAGATHAPTSPGREPSSAKVTDSVL